MKNFLPVISAILAGPFVLAQDAIPEEKHEKRIETIRIVNGDTVVHDVKITRGATQERSVQRQMHIRHDMDEEMDSMLENVDIYLNLDENQKRMMIKRINSKDGGVDEIIKNLGENDDLIIEVDKDNHQTKVIKITVSKEKGEEVKVIEMDSRPENRASGHGTMKHKRQVSGNNKTSVELNVYPNPGNGSINIEFDLEEGSPATLSVQEASGKIIFKKEYDQAGHFKEVLHLEKNKKGMYVIQLNQKRRSIKEKIIVE